MKLLTSGIRFNFNLKLKGKILTTVYVINKGFHDYSDAEQFGELVFLTEGSLNKYCVNTMLRQFAIYLNDSKENDYILISSMSIANSLACSMFAVKHRRLNVLIYNSRIEKYVSRKVYFDNLKEKETEQDESDTEILE